MNDGRDHLGGNGASAVADHDLPQPPAPPVALAVPNVSEGRDAHTIAALADACRGRGVHVLDVHSDPDHHRSVLSVAGEPLALMDAMVRLAWECLDHIDLRRHRGVHPRIGALDVVPFVALTPDDASLADEMARGLGARLGEELALPVFLYGSVASDPAHGRPHDFRRGGMEGLARAIEEGRLVPDFGPHRLHASAGAVMVGARAPLVAWNVWLPNGTHEQARAIAARVREAGGGLPGVRALGLYLPAAEAAQVSMNLEDIDRTPPAAAVAAVRAEADRLGAHAGDSELVGLIPSRALRRGPSPGALGLRGFRPGQVLEAQMPALRRDVLGRRTAGGAR
ncbi:MAG: glutamate formimidoyltransferase [Actinomycetota bacterium]